MCAYIQKVEGSPLTRCRLFSPGFEITLLAVVISMAAVVCWGGFCPAVRLVNRMVEINLLARDDRLSAKIAGHYISMPPILCDLAHRACGQWV